MIGILGAMDIEIEGLRTAAPLREEKIGGHIFYTGKIGSSDVAVAKCGIGKVNAAMCTQTMILTYAPNVILNTGVAGGIGKGLRVMDVVVATAVAQHDLDTTAFGDPMGLIPGLNVVEMPCDETVCRDVIAAAERIGVEPKRGLVVSGDQFIASKEKIDGIKAHFDALAAEMEGASIGQVCSVNKVPFAVIRAISDGGNEEAGMDYPQFVKLAAARSVQLVEEYLRA